MMAYAASYDGSTDISTYHQLAQALIFVDKAGQKTELFHRLLRLSDGSAETQWNAVMELYNRDELSLKTMCACSGDGNSVNSGAHQGQWARYE